MSSPSAVQLHEMSDKDDDDDELGLLVSIEALFEEVDDVSRRFEDTCSEIARLSQDDKSSESVSSTLLTIDTTSSNLLTSDTTVLSVTLERSDSEANREYNTLIQSNRTQTPSEFSASVAKTWLKKKRQLILPVISENTPKRKKLVDLFEPHYMENDLIVSPIAKDSSFSTSSTSVLNETTPIIMSKFKEYDKNMANSTPIQISMKDKLKAKTNLNFSSSKTLADEIDSLISEITAICEEGMANPGLDREADLDDEDGECLIEIKVLDRDDHLENTDDDAKSSNDEDTLLYVDDTVDWTKKTGKFKDMDCTVVRTKCDSLGEDELDGEVEDVLGLNDYDDNNFINEKQMDTLSKTGILSNSKCIVKLEDTLIDSASFTREKTSLDVTVKDCKVTSQVKKFIEETVKKNSLDKDQIIMSQFDTSLYRLEDNSEEMRAARLRWGSNGVANPDVNLTVATTYRKDNMDDGRVSPVGLLEGERLCCLDLADFEQPDHHMTTVAEVLSRLHRQRDVQDCMRYNALRDLRAQMKQDLDNMIHQHSLEFKNLKQRQEHQWKTARGRAAHMLAAVAQAAGLQLSQAHEAQRKRLKQNQQYTYHNLCSSWNETLQKRTEGYRRQSELLQEQIQMMEKAEGVPSVSPQKYGPPVMVTLRKGPCRASGGLPTTANVCLSARIAQAVSLEDDIYDHFYSYK